MSNGQPNARSQQEPEGYPFPLSSYFASAGDSSNQSGPASLTMPRSARGSFSGPSGGTFDGIDMNDIFDDYFYEEFNPSAVLQQQSESAQQQRHAQGGYSDGDGALDQMREQQQQIYGAARGAQQQVSWDGDDQHTFLPPFAHNSD